jgi:glycosyltransferase involved in cell wall biosynthesis
MRMSDTLVSIGLPVRNGADRLERVVKSVLDQDHDRVELVISDNASTDGTEELCRSLARSDDRITYHRQPENIGLLNNFVRVIQLARGEYFRWVGDDDWLAPTCVSRCLAEFAADDRLIMVTTQLQYVGPSGAGTVVPYLGTALASDDPVARLTEVLRLLNAGYPVIDPMYSMVRREPVAAIPRRNTLMEDQVFAAKLALLGPWVHVREVLGGRTLGHDRISAVARRLGIPAWHAPLANTTLAAEILGMIGDSELDRQQRRRARAEVARMYARRQLRVVKHRSRHLSRLVDRTPAGVPKAG